LESGAGTGPSTLAALEPDGEGYWSAAVPEAKAGTLYRYRLDGEIACPDPASRFQPDGPHGPSMVIDPCAFAWTDHLGTPRACARQRRTPSRAHGVAVAGAGNSHAVPRAGVRRVEEARWKSVLHAVGERLLTPVGLRSLSPDHADYHRTYHGDLRVRDAAYHQGTVWPWLIGPFVDAWLRLHPDDIAGAREALNGLVRHLNEACVGSVSEIFDAEAPYLPRGCIAQAWSVAELLRSWIRTATR
jgi:hypothetical protein